ncbi:hypothetical protein LO82_13045 [Vibrio vulnificus]|uniref:DUF945 family protein n=1 Tax=Vibrio vulnificus TaxID=672 RepID=UPI0006AD18EB|nr:DUF945 family protein [Vibrio vulnificus]KOR97515.1 hypothetical protein LO82_13045 [Vibrio vulnificus]HDY8065691.1 DUF945 family protein [Vibrio vulnificus]
MNNLKKIGAVGGAISLALCWPLAVGQIGQNVIEDAVAKLNSAQLQVEIVKYDRGYRTSEVTTRYTIVDPVLVEQFETDGLPLVYEMQSSLKHGLTSLDSVSDLVGEQALPLHIEATTQLNGNTDFVATIDSWNFVSDSEGVAVSTAPMKLSGNATVLGDVDFVLDVPSIQFDFSSGESLHVGNLTGNGKGKHKNGYWLGQQDIRLGEFQVADASAQPLFGLYDAQYLGETKPDTKGERLASAFTFKSKKLLMSDGSEVKDLNLDFSLTNLDMQSFDKLMDVYQNAASLTPEEVQSLMPHIDALFEKGFDVAVKNLSLKLGEGIFENTWNLSMPQGTEQVTQDPMKIMTSMTGDLSTYFSDELVAEYPFIQEGVDELMVMEILQQVEGGYTLKAKIAEGKLMFDNGQQFPLLALLMPALMQ